MLSKEAALSKIQKCLALANSSNPNESAAALRQARKLMDKYQVELIDLDLVTIGHTVCTGVKTPSRGISSLLAAVGRAFGCSTFSVANAFVFVGTGLAHEIAAYSFTVVRRQLDFAWKERLQWADAKMLCRNQKANVKNAFEIGFASGVYNVVSEFASELSDEDRNRHEEKLSRVMGISIRGRKPRKVSLTDQAYRAYQNGLEVGKQIKLHRPLNAGQESLKLA